MASEIAAEPGTKQTASLSTRLPEAAGYPNITIDQYWDDLKHDKPAKGFVFTRVPPIFQTTIGRGFAEADGGTISLPGASVSLLPGEERKLDLGPLSEKQREFLKQIEALRQPAQPAKSTDEGAKSVPPHTVPALFAAEQVPDKKNANPGILSYGDDKPDGKKSLGGSGEMIRFELPEGVTKIKGIRIHGSRYGYPQAPKEDFEITFLNDKRDETLHVEAGPYRLFNRGKEQWVRVAFKNEVELPRKFWVCLNFNAQQTKGVYVSYDTSTKGEYSRVGLPGDKEEPKETDFKGDWMVQLLLAKPEK